MTHQTIYEALVRHYEKHGEIMPPAVFYASFRQADMREKLAAIYQLETYLEGLRKRA